jgi:hypothetical protein
MIIETLILILFFQRIEKRRSNSATVVGIASKGWRVMSKNFHGKQLTAFFLKKRGWGSCVESARILLWATKFLLLKERLILVRHPLYNDEEDLLLVSMLLGVSYCAIDGWDRQGTKMA